MKVGNEKGTKMKSLIKTYLKQVDGATAIEYGLIASGVCLVIAASIFMFGEELESMITGLSSALDGDPEN